MTLPFGLELYRVYYLFSIMLIVSLSFVFQLCLVFRSLIFYFLQSHLENGDKSMFTCLATYLQYCPVIFISSN